MTVDPVLVRRIFGTATVVLVLAVGAAVLQTRFAPGPATYEVTAALGDAGSGLRAGNDVKLRGTNIGRVGQVRFEDGQATATLILDDEPALPPPDELDLTVTAKTLLGEKQIDLDPGDAELGQGPSLEAGDTIVASREPTELQAAIDELQPFISAIDPEDLATIVETLGQQQGEGERIAENLELGQRLAEFGDETADDALSRMRALSDVAETLAPATDDLGRASRALPEATRVLRERQGDLRRNLETVTRAATTVEAFLDAEEGAISRMLETSQPVGEVLERQQDEIGRLVEGVGLYAQALGAGGMLLDDGTEWAGFRVFVAPDEFDVSMLVCTEVPDLPGCDEVTDTVTEAGGQP